MVILGSDAMEMRRSKTHKKQLSPTGYRVIFSRTLEAPISIFPQSEDVLNSTGA